MSIIKQYIKQIFEFADSKDTAKKFLRGRSHTFSQHVCKLFLWGSQDEKWIKDWSDEIWNHLDKIKDVRLKPKSRIPNKDFFLNFFFYPYLESVEQMDTMLASVENTFRSKENYPKTNFVDPEKAHKHYLEFVNIILTKIQNKTLTYDFVVDACKKYLI